MPSDLVSSLANMPPAELAALRQRVEAERKKRDSRRQFWTYYPDTGPLRRELYGKHLEFFNLGAVKGQRAFISGNRTGKTFAASFEVVCHLTGRYPTWWEGRRFTKPVEVWACGIDAKSVRDTIQQKLLGKFGQWGTGLIPFDDLIGKPTAGGVPESADTVRVKHYDGKKDAKGELISDGVSVLGFKNYEQDRESYQGTQKEIVWFDEECDASIYAEGLTRTMSTSPGTPNGMVMCTFTPLLGISEVVKLYMKGFGTSALGSAAGEDGARGVVFAGWDDFPHLTDETKRELEASYLPHERDARTKGIPSMGAGAIYPVPESGLVIEPFQLPAWFKCVYGMDVGWNRTAVIWGALNEETDVLYLWHEHYEGEEKPAVHAEGIKAPGAWIPGVIDPKSRDRSQKDGERLMQQYTELGLMLTPADNTVASGIYEVWSRMSTGRLKVFSNLRNWLGEFRIYRRDEKGKIVKQDDHLMDATRYLVMSGLSLAAMRPSDQWSSRPGFPKVLSHGRHESDYNPMADAWKAGGGSAKG